MSTDRRQSHRPTSSSEQNHQIRLRGPWQARLISSWHRNNQDSTSSSQAHSDVASEIPWIRHRLSDDWTKLLGPKSNGTVEIQRRFGCPTGLQPQDRVDLVITDVMGFVVIRLNDRNIGTADATNAFRVNIRERLQDRNVLNMLLEPYELVGNSTGNAQLGEGQDRDRLIGEVYLEISSAASGKGD